MKVRIVFFLTFLSAVPVRALPEGASDLTRSYLEFSLGLSKLHQSVNTGHEFNAGGLLGAFNWYYRSTPSGDPLFHWGIGYFLQGYQGKEGEAPSEISTFDKVQMVALQLGFDPIKRVRIQFGYGGAMLTRTENGLNIAREYSSIGTGMYGGASLMFYRLGGMSFMVISNYYDAKAADYTADVTESGNHSKSVQKQTASAFGWYTGLGFFFGM